MKSKVLFTKMLNPTTELIKLESKDIPRKAKAGQFVIIRATEDGERIPLTIADANVEENSVTLIFQIVGETTGELHKLAAGDYVPNLAGPLGNPSQLQGIKRAIIVGGGVGTAIAYPTAKALFRMGAEVTSIVGFRQKDLIILEQEMKDNSTEFYCMTDDGSYGEKGFVTDKLAKLLNKEKPDSVVAIGPLPMMKAVSECTKQFNVPCLVSMNPIMIDGTGMCGCCRLTVNGEMKFACVDGPEFDGHQVDFDEVIRRNRIYMAQEKTRREESCRLMEGH